MRRAWTGALVAVAMLGGAARAQEWERVDDTEHRWHVAGEQRADADRAAAMQQYPEDVKRALTTPDAETRLRLHFEVCGFFRRVSEAERATLCDALVAAMPAKGDAWPFWDDGLRLWKAAQLLEAGTPKDAEALASAVQKHAAKEKDAYTEARARWLLARAVLAGGDTAKAKKESDTAWKLQASIGEPFLEVRLRLLRARLADAPKKATAELQAAKQRIDALAHAADRAELLAAAVALAQELKLSSVADSLEQARVRAAGEGPPTTARANMSARLGKTLTEVLKDVKPTEIVLIIERKGDDIHFDSPQVGDFNTVSVTGGFALGMHQGALWSTDGPRVILRGLRMGNTAEAGQPQRSLTPPFVREFVLAPGDRVHVQANGRASLRHGR